MGKRKNLFQAFTVVCIPLKRFTPLFTLVIIVTEKENEGKSKILILFPELWVRGNPLMGTPVPGRIFKEGIPLPLGEFQ